MSPYTFRVLGRPSRTAVAAARSARGFTLIELMVTLAVASILVTIAVSTYSAQTRKSRRTDAKTALMDLAGREEQYYSTNNQYTNVWANVGYKPAGDATTTGNAIAVGGGYYNVTITNVAAATYTITAVPATVDQQKDTQCAQFTVDNTGTRGALDAGGTDTTGSCW